MAGYGWLGGWVGRLVWTEVGQGTRELTDTIEIDRKRRATGGQVNGGRRTGERERADVS